MLIKIEGKNAEACFAVLTSIIKQNSYQILKLCVLFKKRKERKTIGSNGTSAFMTYFSPVETFGWKKAVTTGTPPSPRLGLTCSSWKNNIIVVGGEDGHGNTLSDVHILDTGLKRFLGINRFIVSCFLFSFFTWCFLLMLITSILIGNSVSFILDTLTWRRLDTTGQILPPRAGHSTVSYGKILFVFGGFVETASTYNDLHMLDVGTLAC